MTVPAGTVLAQSPPLGTIARKGTHVYVTVSTGPANVAVPNVVGQDEARALKALRARALDPTVQAHSSGKVPPGDVIATNPAPGTVVLQGSQVAVLVSSGASGSSNPALLHVPDVKGSTLSVAREELVAANLTVGTVTKQGSETQPPETVISQIPIAGAQLAPGGAVNLVVAEAPQAAREVVVPNVVGKSETTAAAALGAAGLNPTSSISHRDEPLRKRHRARTEPRSRAEAQARDHDHDRRRRAAPAIREHDDHRGHGSGAPMSSATSSMSAPGEHKSAASATLRVVVLAGGRSAEHDVSLASAESVREGLRTAGHEVVWITISRDGAWLLDGEPIKLVPGGGLLGADVVFPALHGPFGEDGTVQGALEVLDVAYVGAGVRRSALCMNKVTFKDLMSSGGHPAGRLRGTR